ncbi:FMRFamide receptor-like [Physella acuta]|uniref:FMRFamide receptor-like n=1 Tax=Physella acuta TaxID=109671 RepID=UPI0027DB7B6F|nr:FMRFamide receptor-like [Physella acuta]
MADQNRLLNDHNATVRPDSPAAHTNDLIYLDDDQTLYILRALMLGATPTISVFGIIGNIFSIIILRKHGLRKCSNILLFSLAVSDLTFLVGFNSVPKLLYEIVGDVEGFRYSYVESYVLFVFYHVFHIVDYASGGTSLTLPMLITFERVVAVFRPLQFHTIVTPRRTWAAVVFVFAFWYTYFIHTSFFVTLSYEMNPVLNQSIGLLARSAYHYANPQNAVILEDVMSYLMMKIPPAVTFLGCLIIGIRVRIASSRRQKMTSQTSKEASSNRTTKMLLAVCSVYTVACGILSLPTYIPQYMYYTMTSDAPSNFGKIMYQVINIVVCINSSVNFVVYVAMNKNFRTTYKSLFTRQVKNNSLPPVSQVKK